MTTPWSDDTWYPGSTRDLPAALCQRRANVNLLRTELLARVIHATRPGCEATGRFLEAVQDWHRGGPGALAAIMMSPWYAQWSENANALRHDLECSASILPESYGMPRGQDPVVSLLNDHGRFAATMAILTRRPATGVALAWDGQLPLRHWGAVVSATDLPLTTWTVMYQGDDLVLQVPGAAHNVVWLARGGVEQVGHHPGIQLTARLSWQGHAVLLEGGQDQPAFPATHPVSPRSLHRPSVVARVPEGFQEALTAAIALLGACWPEAVDDLMTVTHVIVPGMAPIDRNHQVAGVLPCHAAPSTSQAEDLITGIVAQILSSLWEHEEFLGDYQDRELNPPCNAVNGNPSVSREVAQAIALERRAHFLIRHSTVASDAHVHRLRALSLARMARASCHRLLETAPLGPIATTIAEGVRERASRIEGWVGKQHQGAGSC